MAKIALLILIVSVALVTLVVGTCAYCALKKAGEHMKRGY